MTEDGSSSTSIAAPEVRSIQVDGDNATAEVAYRNPAEQVEQFEMERADGQWRVVLPDSFRLEVGFDAPVVAEIVIDDDCRVPVQDAAASILAWPGNYRITVVDPSGVLDRTEHFLYRVPDAAVTGLDIDPAAIPAVSELELVTVQAAAVGPLKEMMNDCLASGLVGPDCPSGLKGATAAEDARATGDFAVIDRVWSEDGERWLFETGTGSIDVTRGGSAETSEFRYTGVLGAEADGTLTFELGPTG
ncbi:hypothetical protein ACFXQA_10315 [Microbacterium sp. P07]|uniref:hypothetical protein n=1 Tax=Microbacterium sp. P07 TaxID=3366952 RepID=UPI0037475D74